MAPRLSGGAAYVRFRPRETRNRPYENAPATRARAFLACLLQVLSGETGACLSNGPRRHYDQPNVPSPNIIRGRPLQLALACLAPFSGSEEALRRCRGRNVAEIRSSRSGSECPVRSERPANRGAPLEFSASPTGMQLAIMKIQTIPKPPRAARSIRKMAGTEAMFSDTPPLRTLPIRPKADRR
jgi:hypothetical protein